MVIFERERRGGPAMTRETHIEHAPRPLTQRLGAILWPSFFAAGVATTVFFANLDPLALRDISYPDLEITRSMGYTLGFFSFWLGMASSSTFTWWLLRPTSRFNPSLPPER